MKNKTKRDWLLFLIVVLVIIAIFLAFIVSFAKSDELEKSPRNDIKIHSELSHEDNLIILDLVEELNPLYLDNLDRVIFVYSAQEYCWEHEGEPYCDKNMSGYIFKGRGEIIVEFNTQSPCTNQERYTGASYKGLCVKLTLCHEILHSNFISENSFFSKSHLRIMDLAEKEVCYH